MTTQQILEAARSAKSALALADNAARSTALLGMADALCDAQNQSAILAANAEDKMFILLLPEWRPDSHL